MNRIDAVINDPGLRVSVIAVGMQCVSAVISELLDLGVSIRSVFMAVGTTPLVSIEPHESLTKIIRGGEVIRTDSHVTVLYRDVMLIWGKP